MLLVSRIFWTVWALIGLSYEMFAILWGQTQWTLSYQVANLRDDPIFWVIVGLMQWAVYHFLRDNIGGIRGVF